jgi:hypothetical protein
MRAVGEPPARRLPPDIERSCQDFDLELKKSNEAQHIRVPRIHIRNQAKRKKMKMVFPGDAVPASS